MDVHGALFLKLLLHLAVLFPLFLVNKCRKLDEYTFPVYTTGFCPRNETEWSERSSLFNCTGEDNTYACFPNDEITELIEFCYPLQIIAIPPGLCLFLSKAKSRMEAYECETFEYGCPESPYRGSTIFKYPSCVSIGNGCFLAEPYCESSPTSKPQDITTADTSSTTFSDNSSIQRTTSTTIWIAIFFGIIISITGCITFIVFRKKKITCRRNADEEDPNGRELNSLLDDQNDVKNDNWKEDKDNSIERNLTANSRDEELESILTFDEKECGMDNLMVRESKYEKDVIEDWQNEDKMFVPTKASKEVGKMIKYKRLVIVAGHSGCGKTAIVQHVALRYRRHGWLIKPINTVEEIKEAYTSKDYIKNKTMFVFNDPIGKESLSEVLYTEWKKYEQTLTLFLTSVKIVLSCRKCIVFDTRVKGIFEERSNIVVIDDIQNKLTNSEKNQILKNFTDYKGISEETTKEILKVETYFPLLCKLFASNWKHSTDPLCFFTEPKEFIQKEITIYKKCDIVKYCGLVCLVFFNNNLGTEDLIKREGLFKKCLNLCGVQESLPPGDIIQSLELLEGVFVKKICDTFHFYHDFILEVTTFALGTDHPREIIKHADIRFLQRRVRLENTCSTESSDQFSIILKDTHIKDLVDRLSKDICKDRFIEVVLNPCLRDKKVMDLFIERMNNDSSKMIAKLSKLKATKLEANYLTKENWFSRIDFLYLFEEVSPLLALIVFRHDMLVRFFLKNLKKRLLAENNFFLAMCCNGAKDLYEMFPKKKVTKFLKANQFVLHPIHIASIFHNYELLEELIKQGGNVNLVHGSKPAWTPLTLAIYNIEHYLEESNFSSRDKTVKLLLCNGAMINMCKNGFCPLYLASERGHENIVNLLLNNGADVNLCNENGYSPLSVACQNGHESIVQLSLNNRAYLNLCNENGYSPLSVACQNGHDSIVQLLVNNGADVNLCNDKRYSPLSVACQNGHYRIVHLLLNNGADVNFFNENGLSPLSVACQIGHESIMQLLLNNGADVNLCNENGLSALYVACQKGHDSIVQLLLNNGADENLCYENGFSPLSVACQNGHRSIVHFLLNNGADVNLCAEKAFSSLSVACQNGHYSIVQLLLNNGVDVNLCNKNGISPLYVACQNGHDSIVQFLLKNSADVNLCNEKGFSPLSVACQKGHESIVKLLLNNGAHVNLCNENGFSPLSVACQNGHDSIVHLFLINGADVNLCNENGFSPLYVACQKRHESIMQLLLNNGADVNICNENKISPLYVACQYEHDSIIQLLLNNGADVNLCAEKKFSPLYVACQNGHYSVAQLLVNNRADVNLCNENGFSPLSIACQKGHESVVQLLLNNGGNVNLCNEIGFSPLSVACQNGHDSIVQLLLNNGADVNLCNENGFSPLSVTCLNGHESIVQLLLNNGGEVNLCNENGFSPLSVACQKGHDRIVKLLLINGVDVNLCNKNGFSALYAACQKGHYSIVQLLLINGADVNLCDEKGFSPLYAACQKGHDNIVQLLLNNDADVNLCNENGFSPLYVACRNGLENIAQFLLMNGADVNLCNKNRFSPLSVVCRNGHESIVQLLLNNGADVNLCNEKGFSPLYAACENGHDSIVELLLNNGADVNLCNKEGCSPFFIANLNGHTSTAQILLNKRA